MAAYTTEIAIENYLLTDIDASFSSQITEWITAVSDYIDKYTGRKFIADSAASARLFGGGPGQELLIDDCVEITVVEIGDTYGTSFTPTTDYVKLPLNELPTTMLGLKNRGWGTGLHRVTAKWGYSVASPTDIKFAATVLAAGIVNTQVKTGAAKKGEHIGNYSVTYHDDNGIADYERALAILDTYKRITL